MHRPHADAHRHCSDGQPRSLGERRACRAYPFREPQHGIGRQGRDHDRKRDEHRVIRPGQREPRIDTAVEESPMGSE